MKQGNKRGTTATIPILTFHDVDDRQAVISFPPDVFRAGFAALHEKGYRTLDLLEAASLLRSGETIPEKSLVLTFDDGFRGVYENAFPTLRRLGMTATVFLSVGGPRSSCPEGRLPSLEGRSMLSWEEIREMHGYGVRFGAHTLTHPDLTGLNSDRIDHELGVSKRIIEDELGAPVDSFAYPFGLHNETARTLARRYFSCACSDTLGFARRGSDPFALERVDAYYLRTSGLFSLVSSGLFSWYVRARAIPRNVRRSLAKL